MPGRKRCWSGRWANGWGRRALLFLRSGDGLVYVGMALAGRGWTAFPLMPLFALGGTGMPIFQSMLSGQVDGYRQGAVIGLFSGLTSFVSIFAPFTISMIYFATRARAPGTVWILGASMQLVAVQFVLAALKDRRAPVVA